LEVQSDEYLTKFYIDNDRRFLYILQCSNK